MNLEAFFKLTYGLYLITTKDGDKLNGYIANTAFQVTAEPAQIAISCSKENFTCDLIKNSLCFSISILKQDAKSDLIGLFGYQSGKNTNKFKQVNYITSSTGAPIVTEDCVAWFDCKVNRQVDVGSHVLFIATIESNDLLDKTATPLTYSHYHETKKAFAPKNAPTYIDPSKLVESNTHSSQYKKYKCLACGYIYDPAIGDASSNIPAGTPFEELPEDWTCPTCGSPKEMFEPL